MDGHVQGGAQLGQPSEEARQQGNVAQAVLWRGQGHMTAREHPKAKARGKMQRERVHD